MVEKLEGYLETLPALAKSIEDMSDAELLGHSARVGLMRVIATITREREPDDIKGERLSAEMGIASARLYAHVQEAGLRGHRQDQLARILAAIAKAGTEPDTE